MNTAKWPHIPLSAGVGSSDFFQAQNEDFHGEGQLRPVEDSTLQPESPAGSPTTSQGKIEPLPLADLVIAVLSATALLTLVGSYVPELMWGLLSGATVLTLAYRE